MRMSRQKQLRNARRLIVFLTVLLLLLVAAGLHLHFARTLRFTRGEVTQPVRGSVAATPRPTLPARLAPAVSAAPLYTPHPDLLNRTRGATPSIVTCINVTTSVPSETDLAQDLPNQGRSVEQLIDEAKAARLREGDEGPVVVLTYQACHGALSQHYGHLSAMVVAKQVRADVVVLPHARTRQTYASRNLLGDQDANHTNAWREIHLSSIYRTASFESYLNAPLEPLGRYGVERAIPRPRRVWAKAMPAPPGNVSLPTKYAGFASHHHTNLHAKLGVAANLPHIGVVYKRRRPSWMWRKIIEKKVARYPQARAVLVDLGCTDIMVGANPKFNATTEDLVELGKANSALQMAGYLADAGRDAAEQMKRIAPHGVYTGLHLRLERDMFADKSAKRWAKAYERAKSQFLNRLPYPLLMASGIFEYQQQDEMWRMLSGYYNTHELYHVCLSETLPNDVRPWVDYLALKEGAYFQGHEYSVLSWLVVQQRTLDGKELNTSSLIRKANLGHMPPKCCEGDRCLVTVCADGHGSSIDVMPTVTEDPFANPPIVSSA